ncbi:type II toxin-antitoxin system Phd/YefM family antitoxin [Brachybacterium alimentarium]|uniref:type II toxin-antitoxin system Phd/YefM family antitoxin n=1 Tax=Brachybacterium alimentarium TaxID=47845 RepID=UPI003FD08796
MTGRADTDSDLVLAQAPCYGVLHRALRGHRSPSDRQELSVMSTIPHRELRNHSTEILRRVEAGETFSITNNGRTVARLVPYSRSPLDALRETGRVSAVRQVDLEAIPPVHGVSSREILDDLRGEE